MRREPPAALPPYPSDQGKQGVYQTGVEWLGLSDFGHMVRFTPAPRHSAGPMDGDKLLNTPDAAGVLGVSPRTLEDWRFKKEGPPYRKLRGWLVRYRLSDLLAYGATEEPAKASDLASEGAT